MARMITRRHTLMSLALLGAGGRAFAQAEQDPDPWPDLKHMFFNDASIEEDKSLVKFEAPPRAEDAALVPVSFSAKLPPDDKRRTVKLTLVIDQNPVPLAAAFTLGAEGGRHAHLDPGQGEFLHQRARRGRAQRRLAAYGDPLHQGLRRVLGADGQEHGRGDGRPWPDEVPHPPADA